MPGRIVRLVRRGRVDMTQIASKVTSSFLAELAAPLLKKDL
jgi:hypothetical protein